MVIPGQPLQMTGMPQLQTKIPNAIAAPINALVGDVVELYLPDLHLRLQFPASAAGHLEQYVKPKLTSPAQKPSSGGESKGKDQKTSNLTPVGR